MPRVGEYILPTTPHRKRYAIRKDRLMTWLDRHLDEQALLRFHYHQLELETYQRLASHLEECVSCRLELDRLEEILVQSPAPDLQFGATDQSGFWTRMRRRRRIRRLRRGVLALLLAAMALLLARYPDWHPLPLAKPLPTSQQPAKVALLEPQEHFDLPLGPVWLQRYLPAADAAGTAD